MRLLELCLLPLLSPQAPTPDAAPTTPAAPAPATTPADDERQRLLAAERAGADADPATLRELAQADDAAIAARAAWLLGNLTTPAAAPWLYEVATASPHAEARRQAMHALLRQAQVASFPTGIAALADADPDVRTLAAQLLGKLRRPAGISALVARVEQGDRNPERPATDLQAVLVALGELGAADQLLRVATALHDRPAQGVGQALTWCFQQLAPKLPADAQSTLLVAVLDHREPLLRRYAIGRLGELRARSAAQALEGRLAQETPELRPLVEVALAQVRGDDRPRPSDELERARQNATALLAKARARWDTMSTQDRTVAAATAAALLLVLALLGRMRRARARAASAAAAMALVAPSEEHLEQLAAEAEAEAEAMAAAADAEAEGMADDTGFEPAADGAETDGWGEPVADDADAESAATAHAEAPRLGRR
jgi:hypothetical protein